MEKIKIIDLLNKIANGKEPERIRYKGNFYDYSYANDDYFMLEGGVKTLLFEEVIREEILSCLNEEVEIPKEDKKIEKIDMFDYFTGYDFDGTSKDLLKHLERNFEKTNEKLNEIIDYINKEKE